MTLRSTLAAAPGLAVVVAITLAGLCVNCIVARTHLPIEQVLAELAEINAARRRRSRPIIGPYDVRCQGCEAAVPVYRMR